MVENKVYETLKVLGEADWQHTPIHISAPPLSEESQFKVSLSYIKQTKKEKMLKDFTYFHNEV